MPGGYWNGLIEGFQGRRESEYQRNYERDLQNRQLADRVFSYLLNSRDPEMQTMALRGMMSPVGGRQKGLSGFLGKTEDAASPILASMVARMNEMVPDESGAPHPSASPGSAAMSTNTPVHLGSAAIQPSPAPGTGLLPPPDFSEGGEAGIEAAEAAPPLEPELPPAPPPMPMGPPPESKWKRRGTGVPTAEEVAEMTSRAQLQGRIEAALSGLTQVGASPEDQQAAVLGMLGAPQNQRQFSAPGTFGVEINGQVVPVSFDAHSGRYFLPDGKTPVPNDAKMVRMTGASGTGGHNTKEPDPTSPTRWSMVYRDVEGNELYRVPTTPFVPPPAYSGTTIIADPTNPQVPVVAPINRGGGVGPPLADAPRTVESELQTQAKALKAAVDDNVKLQQQNVLGRTLGVSPQQRDALVREKAKTMGLPFTTYDEVVAAAQATQPVTPRQKSEGGTAAERVLRRLQGQGGSAAPPRPPTRPPMRSRGPGPGAVTPGAGGQ